MASLNRYSCETIRASRRDSSVRAGSWRDVERLMGWGRKNIALECNILPPTIEERMVQWKILQTNNYLGRTNIVTALTRKSTCLSALLTERDQALEAGRREQARVSITHPSSRSSDHSINYLWHSDGAIVCN